jgi:acylaminoacyl-peptidase
MVLIVHGGPHSMYGNTFYFNMQVLAGHGIACLYINPRGSSGYGLEFMQAVHGDWGGKDFHDLMNGVDAVLSRGEIDEQRMAITGGSYGGFMTNWTVGHTDRFRCGVAINALSNLVSFWGTSDIGPLWTRDQIGGEVWEMPDVYARLSPLTYVREIRTPLLLLHAENDYRVPIEQSEQMFSALEVLGQEVELIRIPDASHGLAAASHARHRIARWELAKEWFDRYFALDVKE